MTMLTCKPVCLASASVSCSPARCVQLRIVSRPGSCSQKTRSSFSIFLRSTARIRGRRRVEHGVEFGGFCAAVDRDRSTGAGAGQENSTGCQPAARRLYCAPSVGPRRRIYGCRSTVVRISRKHDARSSPGSDPAWTRTNRSLRKGRNNPEPGMGVLARGRDLWPHAAVEEKGRSTLTVLQNPAKDR